MVCDCGGFTQARRVRVGYGEVARRVVRRGSSAAVLRAGARRMGESGGHRRGKWYGVQCGECALQPHGVEQHHYTILLDGMLLFLDAWTTQPQARRLDAGRAGRRYKRTFLLRDTAA